MIELNNEWLGELVGECMKEFDKWLNELTNEWTIECMN